MNKKAQSFIIPIAVFVVVIIGAFIGGIILLYVNNTILTPFATSIEPMSSQASESVNYINLTFTSFWDWAIIIFFLSQLMLLFLSAFLIDTHPVFLVVYIIACAFLMMFMSDILNPVERIYDGFGGVHPFLNQSTAMPLTYHLVSNFNIILLGIMMVSGVVIYAKIKYFGAMQG